jgi:hypothetical protein
MKLTGQLNRLVRHICVGVSSSIVPAHYLKGVIIAHTPKINDSNYVENPPSRLSLLAVPLKGYDLFSIGAGLVFGTWKVLLSGHDGFVVLTKVEFSLLMITGLMYAFFIFSSWGRGQARCADCLSDYITPRCWRNAQNTSRYSTKSTLPLPFGDLFIVLRVSAAPSCPSSCCFGGGLLTTWLPQCISFFCHYRFCG